MTPPGLELVEAGLDPERLRVIGDLLHATQPEHAPTVETMLARAPLSPDMRRVIALLDGTPVGLATVGRIWVYPPDHPTVWCEVGVVEGARGRGVGSALLAWAQAAGREAGKQMLRVPCSDGRPEGIAFLARRGFVEFYRMTTLELPLAGVAAPAVDPPAGIAITSLGARPDLRAAAYRLAVEVYAALPDPDPVSAGDFEEWRVRDVDVPNAPLDAYLLALAGDEPVGYCRLYVHDRGASVGHMMTGVAAAWRGRGVASALKRAALAWALEQGAERMTTENAPGNAPMLAINRRFGYRATPDFVEMDGPVQAV
ncbi:MAG: N-acetyltransferase family protein [Actinomycetota bacterium]